MPVRFRELLVSPNGMKKRFISLINAEIKNRKAGETSIHKDKDKPYHRQDNGRQTV